MDRLIVGVRDDGGSTRDAIALGVAAANTVTATLTFSHVFPTPFDFPGGAVDPEWRRYLKERSDEVLNWAREVAGDPPGATYLSIGETDGPTGLAELAEALPAAGIVIGSASGGRARRMFAGTMADRLLHGSSVPVAVAPAGYSSWAPERFTRFVVAYQGTEDCARALRSAAETAQQVGASIHLLTVLERMTRIYGTKVSRTSEDEALTRHQFEAERLQAEAAAHCPSSISVTGECVRGSDVASALAKVDWQDEDVLVVGSGRSGLLRRVFLGDMSFKILNAAEVPVFVLPRSL